MGAQQSSSRSEEPSGSPSVKTCYYELLTVDRQATDEEIKKAYRRKALELHPDRNIGNVAIATQKFAEVQAAYEVLSDPQERAWYDNHRDAILSGNDGLDDDAQPTTFRNVRLTSTEEIHGLMRKFNATIPFDDEPTGFFGIARETFEHLALEEAAAAEFDGGAIPAYPTFGSSGDDYESVVRPFYNAWGGFSTRKAFSWKDKYRLSDAPDRRVRRLMEKENRKIRDDAIREFNDAVRFLVVFVRKRDPRYLPNTQTDAERQKSMRDAAAAQAAKARAANQEKFASYEVPEWVRSREDSAEEDHFPETEEELETEVLECIVCNKIFKSDKQLQVHETSKKHIKTLQKLRWQMKKEGADLELESETETQPMESSAPIIGNGDDSNHATRVQGANEVEHRTSNNASEENQPEIAKERDMTSSFAYDSQSDDEDYAPRSAIQDRLYCGQDDPAAAVVGDADIDCELSAATEKASVPEQLPKKKMGMAKAKREKKAAKSSPQAEMHRCSVCNEEFASRTKLFQHIRADGHVATTPAKITAEKHTKKRR